MGGRRRSLEGLVITPHFWNGRRVLVTGHTGFKGAWLALMLNRLDAVVSGYALSPANGPALYDLAGVANHIDRDVRGDIADYAALHRAFEDANPEIVLHLAAQPLVKAGYVDPLETYRVNVLGLAQVLEVARHRPGLRAILVITSDKCYEPTSRAPRHRESDRLGGSDPYSASKACAEIVTASYRASFCGHGPVIATARSGNVIGGGDFAPDRIVPDAIRAFMSGVPLAVRRPGAVRPWQHVLEPLHGYILLAEQMLRENTTGAWNFGPTESDERDVEQLVRHLIASWGPDAEWRPDRTPHPPETDVLRLDSTKAREQLGWGTLLDFPQAVEWTCAWYRALADGADMQAATLGQIDAYFALRAAHQASPRIYASAGH